MRTSTIVLSTALAVLLAGCASTAPASTQTPAATTTPQPTSTPSDTPSPTPTPDPLHLDPVGQFGGTASALVVRDTTAFVTVGARLETFDISDPANPALVGRSEVLPLTDGPIAAVDQYLVVSAGAEILVLDAPSHGDPMVVARMTPPYHPIGIVVSGHVGFITSYDSVLQILDLSDPRAPKLAGQLPLDADGYVVYAIAVSGETAFVANANRVLVVDISDPADPKIVSTIDSEIEWPWSLAVSGSRLYRNGATYDISNLAAPKLLGTGQIVKGGNTALGHWVFTDTGGVFDFTDPWHATPVSTPLDPGDSEQASSAYTAVRGHLLIVTGPGLQIFDLSQAPEPQNPDCECADRNPYTWPRIGYAPTDNTSLQFEYASDARHSELRIAGDNLYTFTADTLSLWSLENPIEPELLRTLDIPTLEQAGIQVDSGIVFTKPHDNTFSFLDTRDPANPSMITAPAPWTTGKAEGFPVAAKGNYLFVNILAYPITGGNDVDTLAVYDMRDPHHPIRVGSHTPFGGGESGDLVAGNVLLAYPFAPRALVFDISNPRSPQVVDRPSLDLPGGARSYGGYDAFFLVEPEGLTTYAPENLERPLATLHFQPDPNRLMYADGFIWSDPQPPDEPGVLVDVRDPAHPRIIAHVDISGDALAVAGGYVYLNTEHNGVYIYKLPPG